MLALTRKKNETIIIDNKIEITILDIKGEQIKIGVKAPSDVAVYRKEIYSDVKEANVEASTADAKAKIADINSLISK